MGYPLTVNTWPLDKSQGSTSATEEPSTHSVARPGESQTRDLPPPKSQINMKLVAGTTSGKTPSGKTPGTFPRSTFPRRPRLHPLGKHLAPSRVGTFPRRHRLHPLGKHLTPSRLALASIRRGPRPNLNRASTTCCSGKRCSGKRLAPFRLHLSGFRENTWHLSGLAPFRFPGKHLAPFRFATNVGYTPLGDSSVVTVGDGSLPGKHLAPFLATFRENTWHLSFRENTWHLSTPAPSRL